MIGSLAQSLLPLASWVLFASLKSLVVIPLVLVIRRLCSRWLTPQGRYGLWFALIACLSIPVGGQLEIHRAAPAATPAPLPVATRSVAARHESPIVRVDQQTAAVAPDLSMAAKAVLVWLLGAAGLAGTVACNVQRYRRMKAQASDVDARTDDLFQGCRRLLRLRQRVGLLESSRIPSPAVVGYWRPTLLLPRALSAQISGEQLRLVLLHELAHVRRHDILVNWVVTLVQIVHWFNPLAWYALRVMRDDMEHACDASVLRHLSVNERGEYGDTLIRLSDLTPRRTLLVQNAGMVESPSRLKSRISMIAQFRPRGVFSSLLAAGLITLTSAIAVTQAASTAQPTGAASQPGPTTATKQDVLTTTAATPQPAAAATGTARAKTQRPANAGAKAAPREPALESAVFPIRYAAAKDLVLFVRSAAGKSLLTDRGSVAVDERTNTLFVQDTAGSVATVRLLVAQLDVPVRQVLVSAVLAVADNDLLQELLAGRIPAGAWSPATDLGPEDAVTSALEAAQLAHRVEIISRPRFIVANHAQSSIEQNAGLPASQDAASSAGRNMYLRLAVAPTVGPDNRVMLAFDAKLDMISTVVIVTGGVRVPSIDTREAKSQVVLDSGTTVMLDVMAGDGGTPHSLPPGQRLVAFVTPKLLP